MSCKKDIEFKKESIEIGEAGPLETHELNIVYSEAVIHILLTGLIA